MTEQSTWSATPEEGAPRPQHPLGHLPPSDIARDVISAGFLLFALFYRWNFSHPGGALWWVIISTLCVWAGLAFGYAARLGVLGPTWDNGLNRLIRLMSAGPFALSFVALLADDALHGANGLTSYALGGHPSGGVGPGALMAMFAIVLAVQPRVCDVGHQSVNEARAWYSVAAGLGLTGAALVALTGILDLSSSGLLGSLVTSAGLGAFDLFYKLLLLLQLATALAVTTLPVVGMLRKDAGFTNLVVGVGGGLAVADLLSFDHPGAFSMIGLAGVTNGESLHSANFGAVFFAGAGAAACAPGISAIVGKRLDRPAVIATAGRLLLLIAIGGVAQLVSSIAAIAICLKYSVTPSAALWLSAILPVGVIALGAMSAGAINARRPDAQRLALIAAGYYAGASITLSLASTLSARTLSPSLGRSWVLPLLVALAMVAMLLGADGLRDLGRGLATRFATPDAAGQPAEGPLQLSAAPQDPQPEPTTSAQQWGTPPPPPPETGIDPAVAAASDPTTSASELARLAYEHPQTRVAVAGHPNAYPGLLSWLADLGDPDIDDALRRRMA